MILINGTKTPAACAVCVNVLCALFSLTSFTFPAAAVFAKSPAYTEELFRAVRHLQAVILQGLAQDALLPRVQGALSFFLPPPPLFENAGLTGNVWEGCGERSFSFQNHNFCSVLSCFLLDHTLFILLFLTPPPATPLPFCPIALNK